MNERSTHDSRSGQGRGSCNCKCEAASLPVKSVSADLVFRERIQHHQDLLLLRLLCSSD